MTDPGPSRGRRLAADVWYHVQFWTLAGLALLVVCFMVATILLAAFPSLTGAPSPAVQRQDIEQRRQQIGDRWRSGGPSSVFAPGADDP